MPVLIAQILSFGALAVKVARSEELAAVIDGFKSLLASLFKGGLISVEQQRSAADWADAHQAATLRGEVPPAFTVEPD